MEWKKYRLGCLSHSIQTGPFGSQLHQSDYSEEGTPVIMPKDIVEGRVVEDNIARVSDIHIQRLKRHKVKCGDVVYSRRGDVGRCALVGEKEDGWLCGTGCLKVELNKEKVLPPFLFYILQRQDSVGWVESHAVGSTMPNLNTGILAKLPVFLPTLNLQHRIASILSTYDTLIENNTKRIHLLEKMAENLYKEWFVRFRFPGYEKVEMENGLPKGWIVMKIKECIDRLAFGQTYQEKELQDEGNVIVIDQSTKEYLGYHNNVPAYKANVDKPILLFGDHSCKFKLMIQDFSLGENVIPFISTNDSMINRYYLYFAVHKLITTEEYKRHWGRFVAMKIFVPEMSLQMEFSHRMKQMELYKEYLAKQNTLLVRQRDLLLPRLMSGKLEVKP